MTRAHTDDMIINTSAPRIFDSCPDDLDSFKFVLVRQRSLREGMVLVDPEIGTPVYMLDHRMPNTPGFWFVYDAETGAYGTRSLSNNVWYPAATGEVLPCAY